MVTKEKTVCKCRPPKVDPTMHVHPLVPTQRDNNSTTTQLVQDAQTTHVPGNGVAPQKRKIRKLNRRIAVVARNHDPVAIQAIKRT